MKFIVKISCQYLLLIYVVIILLTVFRLNANASHSEDYLELIFRERSHADWKDVWHQEAHSRCRDKLLRHLYWACEKDIYRLTRRNDKRNNKIKSGINLLKDALRAQKKEHLWFLNEDDLPQLLRVRRTPHLTITNECCTKHGCTWEEYAEYCPSNKRKTHY